MKRIILYLTFIIFIPTSALYAQENPNVNFDFPIPPSPTAASLGNFGDIPVSYYTGTPSISIPLYEITEGNISVPITLSYDATGVRVSQDASWVGLGWSLSCGGVVTRSIRGLDDFGGFGHVGSEYPLCDQWNKFVYLNPDDYTPEELNDLRSFFPNVMKGVQDGEPDIFSFNFGRYSGKFLFDTEGNIHFAKNNDNLEIVGTPMLFGSGFTITVPNGTKYIFNTKETTIVRSSMNTNARTLVGLTNLENRYTPSNPSTLYLDKIISSTMDTIKFVYKSGYVYATPAQSYNVYMQLNQSTSGSRSVCPTSPSSGINVSRQRIYTSYLDSIHFSNGWIKFKTTDRLDLEPVGGSIKPQKLSEIIVYNNKGEIVKDITLDNNSYFTSYGGTGNSFFDKRLKLDGVEIDDENNTYQFGYIEPNLLPDKLSWQQDAVGLYSTKIGYTIERGRVIYDMRTDETGILSQRGLLNSIVYPTKGRTEFEYEPHDFENGYTVYNHPGGGRLLVYSYYYENDPENNNQDTHEYDLVDTFYVGVDYSGYVDCTVTFTVETDFEKYSEDDPDRNLAYLYDIDGLLIHTFRSQSGSHTFKLNLDFGEYYIELRDLTEYAKSYVASEISYNFSVERARGLNSGFGNRVKTITNYDKNGIIGQKKFSYRTDLSGECDGDCPSGLLLSRPLKSYFYTECVDYWLLFQISNPEATYADYKVLVDHNLLFVNSYINDMDSYNEEIDNLDTLISLEVIHPIWHTLACDYLVSTSSTISSVSFGDSPSAVGYSKVTVTDGLDHGKTVYNYHNIPSDEYERNPLYGYRDLDMPILPHLNDPRNGQLLSVEYYDDDDNLVKKIENTYVCKEKAVVTKGVKIYPERSHPSPTPLCEVRYYDNLSAWWVMDSTTTTDYFDGNAVSTTTNFIYDNDISKMITEKQTFTSDNKELIESYKYPNDFANNNNVYRDMVDSHILSPVVEKIVEKDNLVIDKKKIDFTNRRAELGLDHDLFRPSNVSTYNIESEVLEEKVSYDKYDSQGKLLQYTSNDGITKAIYWGYNNNYPIAQIANASYNSNIQSKCEPLNLITERNLTTDNKSSIKNVFDEISQIVPQNTSIQLLTYCPLVGITSKTNERGITSYYEYDDNSRLKYIRNDDGNIIQAYDYHYAE